jgi:ABC-2 type transport system permease protein
VIRVELVKQLRRPRGWVTLAAMALVALVVTIVIALTRPSLPERIGDWGSVVTDSTGLALPLIALNAMLLFLLPLGVAVFAGEPVAAESAWGSMRYLLARPIARWRVLGSKALVAAMFSIAAVLVAIVVSGLAGLVAYGWHPLSVVDLRHTTPFHIAAATYSPAAALGRLGETTGIVLFLLASTFAVALFLSTLVSSPFVAVAGAVGFGFVSRALDNIPGLHALSPWLPMTDAGTTLWTGLVDRPSDLGGLGHLAAVQASYTVAFLVAAWLSFTRSDVLD